MRFITLLFLCLFVTAAGWSAESKNPNVGAPSSGVSQGSDSSAGISESPAGTTEKQEEEFEDRPASMGGAPNVGAGMGTGTGAGSKVGNDIEEGRVTAGATSGEEDE